MNVEVLVQLLLNAGFAVCIAVFLVWQNARNAVSAAGKNEEQEMFIRETLVAIVTDTSVALRENQLALKEAQKIIDHAIGVIATIERQKK